MVLPIQFTLAQINPSVGDVSGNLAKIIQCCDTALEQHKSDVVIFPELSLCGYPAEDLLLREDFLQSCEQAFAELIAYTKTNPNTDTETHHLTIIIGHPLRQSGKLFNALSVLKQGKIHAQYCKRYLPNYAVFDEQRYFTAGTTAQVVTLCGVRVGLTVCEDIWHHEPVRQCAELGAELIICINASPFNNQKLWWREEQVLKKKAQQFKLPFIYVNQVGGQDELVFDGSSVAVNNHGEVVARLPAFRESLQTVVFAHHQLLDGKVCDRQSRTVLTYQAIVLGVRDYFQKNHCCLAVLGLSGGVDSALSLAIAVDAIGKQSVSAVMLPSRYTSEMSLEDAKTQAETLGADYQVIPIEPIYRATSAQLAPLFAGAKRTPSNDVTTQNIQARCRGLMLMAIANQFGCLVLTTGNKSELAVGYTTLYGDMVGGFAPIKDVPKMMVYELAKYRNTISPIIPTRVIQRAPSAELAADQKDEDNLPPYQILDPILEAFIEHDHSAEQIIKSGYDAKTVHRVIQMVVANEHKRRQSAPGVRVTSRAFGKDRRYPITSGFAATPSR